MLIKKKYILVERKIRKYLGCFQLIYFRQKKYTCGNFAYKKNRYFPIFKSRVKHLHLSRIKPSTLLLYFVKNHNNGLCALKFQLH